MRTSRAVFVSVVVGTLYSAAEAMMYTDGDHRRMDRALYALGRTVVGAKVHLDDDGDTVKYEQRPAGEVRRLLRLPLIATRMKVRRLSWFQAMLRARDVHGHPLAALWGRAECDAAVTVDAAAGVREVAPRWARAFYTAALELAEAHDSWILPCLQNRVA